jgi:hypothetical protein
VRTKLNELIAKLPVVSYAPVLLENDTPPKTYIHIKGDWRDHGPEVQPGTLAVLPPLPAGAKPTRLTLARWLVSPDHPLTSRVAANRIWQEVFGRGLVYTSEDFGTMGDRPTHPELLDWLASEYMSRGWSTKQMVKLLVTSATYRQSSNARPDVAVKDPLNTLLARQSRLRLPAELIRDEALYAAGLLDLRIGGPSVRPPQPKGVAELSYAGSVKWNESTGADRYRRGLYILFQRTVPYPQLMNFDEPSSNLSCTRRERTNTPLQALVTLNDPQMIEAARALAEKAMKNGTDDAARLRIIATRVLARPLSVKETSVVNRIHAELLAHYKAKPEDAKALTGVGETKPDPAVDASELAAWTLVCNQMLNLDEALNK